MHHWADGDHMAEAYAMISLIRCGYADQKEVASAFGYSARTLRRYQNRYEVGGISALGNTPGRPSESHAKPNLWMQKVAILKRSGMTNDAIAQRLSVSIRTVYNWLAQSRKSILLQTDVSESECSLASKNSSGMAVTGSSRTVIDENIEKWSSDTDPTNRIHDRMYARIGLLNDAVPIFNPGRRIPRAGVLFAVPALIQSGIFSVAEGVYGHIGPAFYGLRTTILAMLLMALLRIKRTEGIKEYVPADIGRLLGLDRAPEVKTLRRKIGLLASFGKADEFGRKLAQKCVARRGRMMGFLYVDGHVRVYHGKKRIPKAYATRLRLALPATTDYWVNDKRGDPVFVVTSEANEELVSMLPVITEEIRSLVGKNHRVTVVFDRGGWSPKLFLKLIRSGFDILTYRKGKWKDIPAWRFKTHNKRIDGRNISYELDDRNIRLLKGRLRLRQVTRLCEGEHQTPIVTSRFDVSAIELAYRMFERWRQENFLKYLREEYALDALVDYKAELYNSDKLIPNPERRKINKKLMALRTKLKGVEAIYGGAVMDNKEVKRTTVRGFKIAHGELGKEIRELRKQIEILKAKHKQLPKYIKVTELNGEPLVRLSKERKHFTDCMKMVAYQAESDLLALIRPHYARADQEGRTLISSVLQNPADLQVNQKELKITLSPLSSEHRSKAVAAMCDTLNKMDCYFPGSKLRMRFGVSQEGQ